MPQTEGIGKLVRVTTYHLPSTMPCCMRGNSDADPKEIEACEARCSVERVRVHEPILASTLKCNEYSLHGHYADRKAMMGEVMDIGLAGFGAYKFTVEDYRG